MTTSVFPSDTSQPFVAENGVTYVFENDRWRVKTYQLDDSVLESYATEEWTEEKIADAILESEVDLSDYATIDYSDAEDQDLQNQIDELGVTKGKVARYTTVNTAGTPVSRPGELSVNTSDPASVTIVSFGVEDADGILTKPMANGDVIEFVDAVRGNVSRYQILDATGAPTVVSVQYVSGDNDFSINEEEQVYIYPQNASGASKKYVDAQDDLKLDLAGGRMTGTINFKLGGVTDSAIQITNSKDSAICGTIWCPGGAGSQLKYVGRAATAHWMQVYDDTDNNPLTVAKFEYESYNFSAHTNVTYGASDAHYFKSNVIFNNGNGELRAKISNSNYDFYNLGRFKDGFVVKAKGQAIEGNNSFAAYPDYTSYTGRIQNDTDIVNKAYCDSVVGGVPTGTVVMWFGVDAPNGWLKCDGSSFDTKAYAALHAHLQTIPNYASGKTPNFKGLYPGGAGSGGGNDLTVGGAAKPNSFHSQRTAAPHGGYPTSTAEIPNGNTRTFPTTGGTNAYSDGLSKVNITENWVKVTRPPTLAINFIIKT